MRIPHQVHRVGSKNPRITPTQRLEFLVTMGMNSGEIGEKTIKDKPYGR
jgi:hypothetical protein